MSQDNPLLNVGFAMPFDSLDAAQIKPAMTALIADARADLAKIVDVEGERTYANTLGALDLAAERLNLAMTVVGHLESVAKKFVSDLNINVMWAYVVLIPGVQLPWNSMEFHGIPWKKFPRNSVENWPVMIKCNISRKIRENHGTSRKVTELHGK